MSVKLMLDWLGKKKEGDCLVRAIAEVIQEGKMKTYDLGGRNTSLEVAEEVAKKYDQMK
jgi:3-isopropylmalate dehydrogenase